MRTKKLAVLVGSLAFVALSVGFLRGQSGGGQGGPGPGFGWGPQSGVRVLDARAGGCVFEERSFGKNASTDYALVLSETRAVLPSFTPPTLPTHTVIHTNGVTYVETTLNSTKTVVCINDLANHQRFVVTLTNTSTLTGTALVFKLESRPHPDDKGTRPPWGIGKSGQNPPWNGNGNPNVIHSTISSVSGLAAGLTGDGVTLTSAQSGALSSASATWPCTTLSVTVFKHGQSQDARVTCSPLGVGVFTLISSPFANSTVIATFPTTAPTPLITLPLSNYSGIKVKEVNGNFGGRRPHGAGSEGSARGA